MPNIDFDVPMTFGMGMQSLKLKARGLAVEGDTPDAVGGGAQTVSFALFKIDSYEQYQRAFSFDADASASYGLFSASAKFEFAEQHNYNSFSRYLIASIVVTNEFRQLGNPRLRPEATAVFANDAGRAYEEFGDSFVLGITTGGSFNAVMEFTSKSSMDLHSISAVLEGGQFGLFSGQSEFSSAVQRFKGQTSLQINSFQQGGANTRQAIHVDDILNKAVGFAPEVRDVAVPFTAFLQDYKALALPKGPNAVDIENARLVMQNFASLRNRLVQQRNEIEYIQTNPDQFVDPGQFDLDGMLTNVSEALNVITRKASACANDAKSCELPTVPLPVVKLPTRQPGVLVPPRVEVPDVTLAGARIPNIAHSLLAQRGLQASDSGPRQIVDPSGRVLDGEVVAQNPLAKTMVDAGSIVVLQLGNYHVPSKKLVAHHHTS